MIADTKVYLFSVHDSNSGYYNIPFFCGSGLEAKHRVRQMLLEQNLTKDKLAGMTLELVGTFDYSNGKIFPWETFDSDVSPELVCLLSDLLIKEVE